MEEWLHRWRKACSSNQVTLWISQQPWEEGNRARMLSEKLTLVLSVKNLASTRSNHTRFRDQGTDPTMMSSSERTGTAEAFVLSPRRREGRGRRVDKSGSNLMTHDYELSDTYTMPRKTQLFPHRGTWATPLSLRPCWRQKKRQS